MLVILFSIVGLFDVFNGPLTSLGTRHAIDLSKWNDGYNMEEDKFFCEECNYITSRRANWSRHITTKKHYRNQGLLCQLCGRKYKTKGGLWKHQQK